MQQRLSLCFFRRWLAVVALLLSWFVGASAKVWTPEEVPVPRYQDRTQYVSNPEHILSQSTVDSLNVILQHLEETKGVQTLVAVLDKLEGDDPYEFAMALARKHGVGDKRTNTGLVIVLAVGDRSYQFLTGNGLEGTLPDGQIQLIEDRFFVPLLKKQDWDGAMLVAIKAINQVAQGDSELKALEDTGNVGGGVFLVIVLFLVVLIYCLYLLNVTHPRCPQCRKRKVEKGGVFEAFEREITGRQEDTNNDLIYDFLDYVLSDNRNREKLKELTEIHLREKEISLEENPNLEEENGNDDFEEPEDEE